MQTYQGHCHCGAVTFEIDSDLREFTTCDCSLCTQRGAVMVKVFEDNHRILSGKDTLTLYTWNMKIAQHYFCKICGIYVFHRKRAAPDYFGVNIKCLEGVSESDAKIRATKGDDMSVNPDGAQAHWPGPRSAS